MANLLNPDFPMNIVEVFANKITTEFPDYTVVKRKARPSDPAQTIGIFPVDWSPRDDSIQISQFGPAINRYVIRIHLLVKHSNEEEGMAIYSMDTKKLRTMLYGEESLRVALAQLQDPTDGGLERFLQFMVRNQRYLNNEISNQFIYLSATDVLAETEQINGGF